MEAATQESTTDGRSNAAAGSAEVSRQSHEDRVDYRTEPSRYRHWKLAVDAAIATLTMDTAEDGGIRPGYKLKLNSYDLGVDIELYDAINRIRFEHPTVRAVIVTSGKDRVFCSGANIFMLGLSSHAWKVNFCKFTNETRNGIEDSSHYSGLKFLAAVNGSCAGGGYELALACDEIVLIDDRSSSVSLPEVPLLGVLPGTGGLTRIIDKRRVRHDLADVFCTSVEGVRGQRAVDWRLVDATVKPTQFAQHVQQRAQALAESGAGTSANPVDSSASAATGIELERIDRIEDDHALRYEHVSVTIDRAKRTATFTLRAPSEPVATEIADIIKAGATWWPLAIARELDDAILTMRTNESGIGTWLLRTEGNADAVLAAGATLERHRGHWLVRETIGFLRRTLARLDVSSRTLFALIEPGSCFAGFFAELAFAADRVYMLAVADASDDASIVVSTNGPTTAATTAATTTSTTASHAPALILDSTSFGLLPMVSGETRLERRFHSEREAIDAARAAISRPLHAEAALALGLITAAPDEIDWADEIRIAIEERAAMSPDALTGLEANLRFSRENMNTRIFGRLSAWQNWIFTRPNAVGDKGALKVYGKGAKAEFDRTRV